jgi:hypothetical protein
MRTYKLKSTFKVSSSPCVRSIYRLYGCDDRAGRFSNERSLRLTANKEEGGGAAGVPGGVWGVGPSVSIFGNARSNQADPRGLRHPR